MEVSVEMQKEYEAIVQRVVETHEELKKYFWGTKEWEVAHKEMEAANEAQFAFLHAILKMK